MKWPALTLSFLLSSSISVKVIFGGNSCQSLWLRLITCHVILWVFVTSLILLCNVISLPNLPNLHIAGSAHVPPG